MKLSRILATGAAAALIGASAFALAGSASAAPVAAPDPDVTYVTSSQLVPEVSPYPRAWFRGDVSAPVGSSTSGLAGLTLAGNQLILNGETPSTGLVGLVDDADFVASGPVAFQIALFSNFAGADTGFTTLVPDDITLAGLASTASWHTTAAIRNSSNVVVHAADSSATLAQFAATLDAETTPYVILAYGVYVGIPFTSTLHSISWNGVTSSFMPVPTADLSTTSISTADVVDPTKGVTATYTGFAPGEEVQFGYGTGAFGGDYGDPVVADANGSATIQFVGDSGFAVGSVQFVGIGQTSGARVAATFAVVAVAVVSPADPELAATGVDSTPYLISGGALVLLGLGFGAASLRRRRQNI